MDIASLIHGYAPIHSAQDATKNAALEYAHSLISEPISFVDFVAKLPVGIKGYRFGGASDDAYYTALLATIFHHDNYGDPFLCAVLNKLALQLTFQTRFLAAGHPPDAFVFDGAPALFPVVMANANNIAGILLGHALPSPAWSHKYPHLTLHPQHLLSRDFADLPDTISGLMRPVGCVATLVPAAGEQLHLPSRYAALAPHVTNYTSYLLAGPADVVCTAKAEVEAIEPQAKVQFRKYETIEHGPRCDKAILLIENIENIPNITIRKPAGMTCRFMLAQDAQDDFKITDYRAPEIVRAKAPVRLATTAPLTDENIGKMRHAAEMVYQVIRIDGGMLIPASTIFAVVNTYLYCSSKGNILLNMADDTTSFKNTELYKSGTSIDGVCHAMLPPGPSIDVPGAGMPLFFTPNLHEWFSHFLIQCFPRVLILRDLGIDAKILVPATLRRKQRDMLHAVGIPDDRLVTIPDGVRVRCDELIVPHVWPLMFSTYTVRIYDELVRKFGRVQSKPTRRILISRGSRQEWRNMLTYDAIRHLLVTKYGFEEIFPERLTLDEEINLFQDVEIMVGAEGAGLYGACFSQAAMKAIILGDEDYLTPILATLADVRGFDVSYVLGESFRSALDLERRLVHGHANFTLDPVEVENAVQAILA